MYRRIFFVAAFHAVFSTFGEHESSIMSTVGPSLDRMFNASIQMTYGFVPTSGELDMVKSGLALVSFMGIMFGGWIAGKTMDLKGRRWTSVKLRGILGLFSSISAIISYSSQTIELFAFRQFLCGVMVSLKVVMVLYIAECSPVHLRGMVALLLSVGNFAMALGFQPLVWPNVFGNEENWVYISVIALTLCVIHLSVASFFPESPKHLYLDLDQQFEAEKSIKFYHGEDADVETIFEHYERERGLVNAERLTLKQVWQNKETRRELIIVAIAGLVPSVSALQVKSGFMKQLLVDNGFSMDTAAYGMNAIVLLTTPFSFLSPYLIEKAGRRPLFLFTSAMCCLEWALLTVSQLNLIPSAGAIISFTGLTAGHLAFKLGVLSLPPIILNETVPQSAKASVTEFLQIFPVLVATFLVITYMPISHQIGGLYNFPFLAISVVLFFLLYSMLPETKRGRQKLETSTKSYGAVDPRRVSLLSID